MSWVKARVDKLMAVAPLELEPAELLRSALTAALKEIASRQQDLEVEANENYAAELLWRAEARRLRQSVVDLSDYIETMLNHSGWDSTMEELPEHVQKAMDEVYPQGRKERACPSGESCAVSTPA